MIKRPELGIVILGQVVLVKTRLRDWVTCRVVKLDGSCIEVESYPCTGHLLDDEKRFRLDDQAEDDGGYPWFVTEAQYFWDEGVSEARSRLRSAGVDIRVYHDIKSPGWYTGTRILALAAFVAQYDKDHPEDAE